jgi:hypothetical protein
MHPFLKFASITRDFREMFLAGTSWMLDVIYYWPLALSYIF